MAKLGEGDARWIVQERADGTNVNGWHWQEKDALQWTKDRLGELLGGAQIVKGEGGLWVKTTTIASCTGEAFINRRKGKIIPSYELEVKVNWEGEQREGSSESGAVTATARGTVHFPYLADENADDDDCEVKVTTEGATATDSKMKEALLKLGTPFFRKQVKAWVKEMAAGGPGGEGPAGGAAGAEAGAADGGAAKKKAASNGAEKEREAAAAKAAAKAKEEEGPTRTIEATERFYCRPMDLFESFTHPMRVRAFTQSDCEVSAEAGKPFKMFSGNIEGENVEMVAPTKIVQKWRFKNWGPGVYSTVTMEFQEPEHGTTIVKLKQTGVPVADCFGNETVVETTERGWREQIFGPIRRVFGFGC